MKLPKKPKHWKIHAKWVMAMTFLFACGMVIWLFRGMEGLKLELADSEQVLKQCTHTLEVWQAQVESGSIKVLKRENGTETIERWEMKRGPMLGDWVGE